MLLNRAKLPPPPLRAERMLFAGAAALALVSSVVWFCLIGGQMSGDWRGSIDPATLELVARGTRFGQIAVARFAGLVALWLLSMSAAARRSVSVPILAGLLLVLLAPSGHAAAADQGIAIAGAVADGAHLLTAGFWLGALITLATLLLQRAPDRAALPGALGLFSLWGSFAVAILVITGAINAAVIVPLSAANFRDPYFNLLLLKVGLAAMMIGLAALNRWRFAPALDRGQDGAVRHLTGSVGIEIALGIGVVTLAACLGIMGPE